MNRKIIAIIQARMGSTRLPGKMMMKIHDHPVIFYLLDQLKYSKKIDKIVVASSIKPENDIMETYVRKEGYTMYRGDEHDVLSRFVDIIKKEKLTHDDIIIRITGDEPLIDPQIVDEVIDEHIKKNSDYTTTKANSGKIITNLLLKGLDLEIINVGAMIKMLGFAVTDYDKEHVTPALYLNPDHFKILFFYPPEHLKKYISEPKPVLTLDTPEDLEFITGIINSTYDKNRPMTIHTTMDFIESEKK